MRIGVHSRELGTLADVAVLLVSREHSRGIGVRGLGGGVLLFVVPLSVRPSPRFEAKAEREGAVRLRQYFPINPCNNDVERVRYITSFFEDDDYFDVRFV